MRNGISVYPGLVRKHEENMDSLRRGAACGIKRVFTSLHIPEADRERIRGEVRELIELAVYNDLEVISDISPGTLEILGIDGFQPGVFADLGISTLRLDYGFGAGAIAELTHTTSLGIQLNGSTVTKQFLEELKNNGADFSRIDALHNFYPRTGTGLSEEFVAKKTDLIHSYGMKVGAFIPGKNKRPPVGEGLPTLEVHRAMDFSLGSRHLTALGMDSVFIGDEVPEEDELKTLANLEENTVTLKAEIFTKDENSLRLLKASHIARPDESEMAIRARDTRLLLKGNIKAENTVTRPRGYVTIDNEKAGRYMGEMQIIKTAQPADNRVNVVGKILPEELFMLKYITPERKFKFV